MAIAGKRASPSLEIALPKRALKGIRPLIKSVVTRTCGPHPGIKPTMIAIRGKKIVIDSKSISKGFLRHFLLHANLCDTGKASKIISKRL